MSLLVQPKNFNNQTLLNEDSVSSCHAPCGTSVQLHKQIQSTCPSDGDRTGRQQRIYNPANQPTVTTMSAARPTTDAHPSRWGQTDDIGNGHWLLIQLPADQVDKLRRDIRYRSAAAQADVKRASESIRESIRKQPEGHTVIRDEPQVHKAKISQIARDAPRFHKLKISSLVHKPKPVPTEPAPASAVIKSPFWSIKVMRPPRHG